MGRTVHRRYLTRWRRDSAMATPITARMMVRTHTPKGVPRESTPDRKRSLQTRDNLSDAYPAETHTSTMYSTFTIGSDGRLVDANNIPVAIDDVSVSATLWGPLVEQVTNISLAQTSRSTPRRPR